MTSNTGFSQCLTSSEDIPERWSSGCYLKLPGNESPLWSCSGFFPSNQSLTSECPLSARCHFLNKTSPQAPSTQGLTEKGD